MSDNIVEFPKGSKITSDEERMSADEALELAKGKFEDVIIIGVDGEKAQCISNVPIPEAIYELSRALHILHTYIDRM